MYMNPNKPIIFKAEQLDWEKLEAVASAGRNSKRTATWTCFSKGQRPE